MKENRILETRTTPHRLNAFFDKSYKNTLKYKLIYCNCLYFVRALIFYLKLNEKSGEPSIAQLCTVDFRSSTHSLFIIILFYDRG